MIKLTQFWILKNKFRVLSIVLIVAAVTLLSGDTVKFKKKVRKPIPTASDILGSCDPVAVHTLGPLKISSAKTWLVAHSRYCLGHKDIVSVISVAGNANIDKDLSVAIVKGFIVALRENNHFRCSFDIIKIPEMSQEDKGNTVCMYPFILDCDDIK
jgi:hypothetical protein